MKLLNLFWCLCGDMVGAVVEEEDEEEGGMTVDHCQLLLLVKEKSIK